MLEGLLVLFIGQLVGSTVLPIGTKIGVQILSPLVFVFGRFLFATIFLLPLFLLSKKKQIQPADYIPLMGLAVLLFINVTLFTIAIQFTTAIMSQILYTATPIVVGIFGHYFLSERLTKHKITGLFIALIGVGFLLFQSATTHAHLTFGTPLGNLLILIAVLGYSAYLLYARVLSNTKKYTSVQLSFFTFAFIGIYLFFINLFSIFSSSGHINLFNAVAVWSVLAVGAGNTVSYFFLQVGIKKTSAFTASLFQYISPFLNAVASTILLHEKPTLALALGGGIIIVGVFYATTYDRIKRRLLK